MADPALPPNLPGMTDFLSQIESIAGVVSAVGGAVVGGLTVLYAKARSSGLKAAEQAKLLQDVAELKTSLAALQVHVTALEIGPEKAATSRELGEVHRRIDGVLQTTIPDLQKTVQALQGTMALLEQGFRHMLDQNERWGEDIQTLLRSVAQSDVKFQNLEQQLRDKSQALDVMSRELARLQGQLDKSKKG